MVDLLLPLGGTHCDISRLQLHIDAHVTREEGLPNIYTEDYNKHKQLQIRTLLFKQNPSDDHFPVSAVLGPNGWLWLAAIISSSFVMFLILLGITTRYYVYPIDHNTGRIFPHLSKALLNMLFVFVSILVTASAAFLWNKKRQRARELAKVEDPSCFNIDGDRELESLPYHSLRVPVRVHYGRRPDLEKIILESGEECRSSVGVIASGPKGMRGRVAAICSSAASANNLNFESISFSW